MIQRVRWHLFWLAVLIGLCLWLLAKVPINYGIDLQGGTELTYTLDLSLVEQNRETVATEVKDIIARRLDAFGLKEISVSVQGGDQLVIQLPGQDAESVDDIKRQIEQAGNLTFRLVAGSEYATAASMKQFEDEERVYLEREREWVAKKVANPQLTEPRPEPPKKIVRHEVEKKTDPAGRTRFVHKEGESRRVLLNDHAYDAVHNRWEPRGMVSGRYLATVGATVDDNVRPAVSFEMKGEGASLFSDLTRTHVGEFLAILLDDDVMQVARIEDHISSRGILRGDFSDDDVRGIITILRGGSLPTSPTLISESTVGSVLGRDSITSGIYAVLVGIAAVMLVMAVYYMIGGMVANVALALNLLLILSYVCCFRQTLTLSGIAGMLLTLAMAVDANILIFERYREERARGKGFEQSIAAGYNRAFWVIFDSNLTTLISGYVLYYLGTGPVKGFAITLISGIFASFFTSVYVTRVLISALYKMGVLRELKMLQAFSTPRIPFTKHQKPFLLASAVLIALTWCVVIFRGSDNYGIDFSGGARVTMNLKQAMPVEQLREKIDSLRLSHPEVFGADYSLQTIQADEKGVARGFALVTRAGGKQAKAQEPPTTPSSPPSPATPAPAPTPPAEAPAGAAPTPAAPAPAPVPPAEAPPASAPAAVATTLSPATPAAAPIDAAQQVRGVLETLLAKEGLLLPPAFPVVDWKQAGPGQEALTLEANLLEIGADVTPESLKAKLAKRFEDDPRFTTVGRVATDSYKGIGIESVVLGSKPPEGDALGAIRCTVKTTAYAPPIVATAGNTTVPTKQQVEDAIRGYFRGDAAVADKIKISEPFPQVSTVGPRVATSLQADALLAIFISIIGIVFYLSLRFEFIYGLAGIIALVHDCMVAIGIMSVTDLVFSTTFPVKLNLNELAAILTIIGFSINDTIVLFDRVRENLQVLGKKKLTLSDIVDISVNQTLARTLWTSTTVFIVTVTLLGFGGESVRGFAYVFAVGTVAGVYSSVFVAAPIAIWLNQRAIARRQEALAKASA